MTEAWFTITAGLLLLSGVSKIVDPTPTRGALEAARLPHPVWSPYVLGIAEIGAAVAGLALGGVAALGVALMYAGFAVFVAYALLRDLPLQSCGCFGKSDTPPTWGHLIVNLTATGAALTIALTGRTLFGFAAGRPLVGVLYGVFAVIGVGLIYLLLSELPRLRIVRR